MATLFIPRELVPIVILLAAVAYLYRPKPILYTSKIDYSQLPDIANYLVTATNPPRSDDALDHVRCAFLHNYIVQYAWVADGRLLEDLDRRSFFDRYGDEADEIRQHLDPSLIAFLENIYDVDDLPFFFWVSGIMPPSDMWRTHQHSDEGRRILTLYRTHIELCSHPDGLLYDQKKHRATLALGIDDHDFIQPVEDHADLWHPLETVLSNWIEMIRIAKITASTEDVPNEKFGPWRYHSYSQPLVDSTVMAWSRLTTAIESRMSSSWLLPDKNSSLLSDEDLDAASIPKSCFVRDLLTRVRTPRFKFIAPGLLVPHDASAFVSTQSFTTIDASSEGSEVIPPVLIFRATNNRANFDCDNIHMSLNPFFRPFRVPKGDHSVLAGLYSEPIQRSGVDNAEEGFRLILPFAFKEDRHGASGPRQSDGQILGEADSIAGLFQHGFKPFGGDGWRAQRLERLLDRWTELVESGVWTVGPNGVEGSIDKFKDAERGAWRDYWIEPDW